MNKPISDYFSENNSPEEQRRNAVALATGMHTGLRYLIDRVARYHDLLDLELDEDAAAKSYLRDSNEALAKIGELVSRLDCSQASARQDFESLDLRVVTEAIINRHNKIGEFEIDPDFCAVDDRDTFIFGNLFLLQQLLLDLPHLLANGNDASPTKMRVRFSVEHVKEEVVAGTVSRLPPGDYLKLLFSSDAQSSAAVALKSPESLIAFEQKLLDADPALYERLLYVAGATTEHRGGVFFAKSDNGTHACVLYFPALKNRVAMYSDAPVNESEYHGDETILLVDDEDIIWDVVIDMLQNMGYTVILAADGNECVEIYSSNPGQIDLVLLDMVMPEMNGHEAFFKLKEIDPNVKVLLSSGYMNEEDARDVLNAGAAGFLQKPYRMLDLAQKVRQTMGNAP